MENTLNQGCGILSILQLETEFFRQNLEWESFWDRSVKYLKSDLMETKQN